MSSYIVYFQHPDDGYDVIEQISEAVEANSFKNIALEGSNTFLAKIKTWDSLHRQNDEEDCQHNSIQTSDDHDSIFLL